MLHSLGVANCKKWPCDVKSKLVIMQNSNRQIYVVRSLFFLFSSPFLSLLLLLSTTHGFRERCIFPVWTQEERKRDREKASERGTATEKRLHRSMRQSRQGGSCFTGQLGNHPALSSPWPLLSLALLFSDSLAVGSTSSSWNSAARPRVYIHGFGSPSDRKYARRLFIDLSFVYLCRCYRIFVLIVLKLDSITVNFDCLGQFMC